MPIAVLFGGKRDDSYQDGGNSDNVPVGWLLPPVDPAHAGQPAHVEILGYIAATQETGGVTISERNWRAASLASLGQGRTT